MVIREGIWRDLPVFVTGHTGFKGSWLALWLAALDARVTGYALAAPTQPALFDLAGVAGRLASHHEADIRDAATLAAALRAAGPRVVFHLAAQPMVRASYRDPVATWATNVMGTVNLLEAVRHCPTVAAVVVVTTDKCYDNQEWVWGYREADRLGGHDPYAASKAAAELAVASYRRSFFADGGPLVATARAGNVIGGGDWGEDRLVPDAARAVAAGAALAIRHPGAVRPWQHVLESLNGYLLLAEGLLAGRGELADAFNFGPEAQDHLTVSDLLTRLQRGWPGLSWAEAAADPALHEARYLHLDAAKARAMLGWQPVWDIGTAVASTAAWYQAVAADPASAAAVTQGQVDAYRRDRGR